MLRYTYTLAERLHIRQRDLIRQFDSKEIYEWMAYDLACDNEFRKKTLQEDDIERQRNQSKEDEANRLRAFFMRINSVT